MLLEYERGDIKEQMSWGTEQVSIPGMQLNISGADPYSMLTPILA
jgi:hypothetical protein